MLSNYDEDFPPLSSSSSSSTSDHVSAPSENHSYDDVQLSTATIRYMSHFHLKSPSRWAFSGSRSYKSLMDIVTEPSVQPSWLDCRDEDQMRRINQVLPNDQFILLDDIQRLTQVSELKTKSLEQEKDKPMCSFCFHKNYGPIKAKKIDDENLFMFRMYNLMNDEEKIETAVFQTQVLEARILEIVKEKILNKVVEKPTNEATTQDLVDNGSVVLVEWEDDDVMSNASDNSKGEYLEACENVQTSSDDSYYSAQEQLPGPSDQATHYQYHPSNGEESRFEERGPYQINMVPYRRCVSYGPPPGYEILDYRPHMNGMNPGMNHYHQHPPMPHTPYALPPFFPPPGFGYRYPNSFPFPPPYGGPLPPHRMFPPHP